MTERSTTVTMCAGTDVRGGDVLSIGAGPLYVIHHGTATCLTVELLFPELLWDRLGAWLGLKRFRLSMWLWARLEWFFEECKWWGGGDVDR